MNIEILIEKILAEISIPEGRSDNILAFGSIYFYEKGKITPVIKVKGFTIRQKQFGNKDVISVTFPAYRSGIKYQTSFIFEDKNLWEKVNNLLLQAYKQKIEEASFTPDQDEVDPDDVPF